MKKSPATNCVVCGGTGKAPISFTEYVDCTCTKPPASQQAVVRLDHDAISDIRRKFGLS